MHLKVDLTRFEPMFSRSYRQHISYPWEAHFNHWAIKDSTDLTMALMIKWFGLASQWHEMYRYDLEVIGYNARSGRT